MHALIATLLLCGSLAQTPAPDAFPGHRESKTFHKAACKIAAKIKPESRVSFATKGEAEKAGYKPCKVCRP